MEEPTVTKLSNRECKASDLHPDVRLGRFTSDNALSIMLDAARHDRMPVYLLTWKGSKVPRGALIPAPDGKQWNIRWTQHGMVSALDSTVDVENHRMRATTIGQYERLLEFEGEDGQDQQMLVVIYDHRAGEAA